MRAIQTSSDSGTLSPYFLVSDSLVLLYYAHLAMKHWISALFTYLLFYIYLGVHECIEVHNSFTGRWLIVTLTFIEGKVDERLYHKINPTWI